MPNARKPKGLVAAMESVNDGTEVVVQQPIEMDKDHTHVMQLTDNSASSAETKMLDMAEAENTMTSHDEMVERGSETVTKLESIHDHLAIAAENGGVDRYSAGAIKVAVEALYEQAGIYNNNMPAMESYGGVASRVGSTTLAMEDIRANVAQIWDAIIAGLKKAWQWVQNFFKSAGAAAAAQLERAKQLVQSKISGQAKEASIENGEMAKAIGINGSVRPDDILKGIDTLNRRATEVFDRSDAYLVQNGERIVQAMEKAISTQYSGSLDFTISAGAEHIPENEILPGNMQFTFNAPAHEVKGDEAVAALDAMRDNGVHPATNAPTTQSTALTVLSPEGTQKAAATVQQILEKVLKYLQSLDVKNRLKQAGMAAMEKAKRAQETAADGASAGYQHVIKLAKSFVTVLDKAATAFCNYVVRVCKRILDYVAESINKYEKPSMSAETPRLENNPTNSVELPNGPKVPASPVAAAA